MNCRDFDTALFPYLDDELVENERANVEMHAAHCEGCASKLRSEQAVLSTIRARARDEAPRAPAALMERISNNLAAESTRSRRRQLARWSVAAAGVMTVAWVGHLEWQAHQRRLFVEEAARRHARSLPLEIVGQPEAVEAWFGGKLDHRVTVPRIPNATTAGARVSNVRDRQAAYIRYETANGAMNGASAQPRRVGLFVFGDESGDVSVGSLPDPDVGSSLGYNVVTWREGDVVYQLVTDLDEADVRSLLPQPNAATRPTLDVQPASFVH